jgi:hypothetical protein
MKGSHVWGAGSLQSTRRSLDERGRSIGAIEGFVGTPKPFSEACDRFIESTKVFGETGDRFIETTKAFGETSDRFVETTKVFGETSDRFIELSRRTLPPSRAPPRRRDRMHLPPVTNREKEKPS